MFSSDDAPCYPCGMPTYTAADRARVAESILDAVANGATLEQLGAAEGWPSYPTLRNWARKDPAFASLIAEGLRIRRQRGPAFNAALAGALLRRIRLGEPLKQLLREPGMPTRWTLDAWKRQNSAFAADLEAAKALVSPYHRRYGRRRSRMRFDPAVADRIMLAVLRGGTLRQLCQDPTLPSPLGLERWRRADPEFDAALRSATKIGRRPRGRARTAAACTPEITKRVASRIAGGASLHSLSHEPGMPNLTALYRWVRTQPAFAAEIAEACEFRDWMLAEQASEIAETLAPVDLKAARRAVSAINKKLGQLSPHPGARKRRVKSNT